MSDSTNDDEIRLDKWLKIARFYKQREKAADEVDSGKVRLNGQRVKPSKIVKIGDVLTIKIENRYRKFHVLLIKHRSVSAEIARTMYVAEVEENETPENLEIMQLLEKEFGSQNVTWDKGKPNKKERRIIQKFKFGQ